MVWARFDVRIGLGPVRDGLEGIVHGWSYLFCYVYGDHPLPWPGEQKVAHDLHVLHEIHELT